MSPERKPTKPIDLYVRVSDVRGRGDELLSTEIQEERCRAQLVALGLKAGETFTDLDVSGTKESRPAFDRLKEKIARGDSGGVIVYKLSRFGRNVKQVLKDVKWTEDQGALFVCVDPSIDTSTPAGQFMLTVFAGLDEMESGNIGVGWRLAKEKATMDRGIHVSAKPPPGYTHNKKKPLTLNPERSTIVQEAFSMAASGEPYARVADYLTEHGIATTSNRVKRLLANRAYLGEARNGHGDVNTGAHPALVDEVTWNLAQRKQSTSPALTKHADNLLSGLVRCASCSFAMRPQKARGTTVASYRCTTVTAHGRCPGPSTISANRIEEYVLDQFLTAAREVAVEPIESNGDEARIAGEAIVKAERSYRNALTNMELREQLGDADHDQMVAAAKAKWQDLLAAIPAPVARPIASDLVDMPALVERLQRDENVGDLRELLGSAIQAVFVRPAASRQRNLPVSNRVKVVFHGGQELELPRRGISYEPRPYQW